ncbi:MAG TPA: transcription termination/antitermination NusG family protein [Acetobacteraceae bacterium]|jgi:transcription antitermination factor NusG|nr:transcription termination/antitermination NusG family protein [Acetobacteraceae bacterium]
MLDAVAHAPVDTADPAPFQARNVQPCGRYWAVAQTHPQAERWAAQSLAQRGYSTFLPLVRVTRRDRVLHSLTRLVEVPLFPGYLFVTIDGPWSPIRYAPGVAALLMVGCRPGRLADGAVAALQGAQAQRAAAGPAAPQWAPGAPCRLATGPFSGQPAVVLATHRDTATLAVLLFGALREVQAPVAWLVRRDDA